MRSQGLSKPPPTLKYHPGAKTQLPLNCLSSQLNLIIALSGNFFHNASPGDTIDDPLLRGLRPIASLHHIDAYRQRHTACIL